MELFEHKWKEHLTEADEKGKLEKIIDKVKSKYFKSGTEDEIQRDMQDNPELLNSFEEFGEKIIGDETNLLSAAYKLYKMGSKDIMSKLGKDSYNILSTYFINKFNL